MKFFYLLIPLLPFLLGATRTLNGGCSFTFGADNASAVLVDLDIGPQGRLCEVPDNATLVEITVAADAGTPSVIVQRFRPNGATTVDLLSAAKATASAGAIACANTGGTTSINGTTTCSATLQNTGLLKGDWLQTKTNAAGAGGTAKRLSVSVIWTW